MTKTFTPGMLAGIQDTIRGGKAVSQEQFTTFLGSADYRHPDFWPAVEIMIGTMAPAIRYDMAVTVSKMQPRDMGPDARAWQMALGFVSGMPVERHNDAYNHIARYAPFGSDVASQAQARAAGQQSSGNSDLDLRGFVAAVHAGIFGRPQLVATN